jgi:hypothetical protein
MAGSFAGGGCWNDGVVTKAAALKGGTPNQEGSGMCWWVRRRLVWVEVFNYGQRKLVRSMEGLDIFVGIAS